VPDVAAIAALRAPLSQNAALWVHLMAATLVCVVILPRLLLGFAAAALERHRLRRLCGDFTDPYFERLLRGFRRDAVRVTVIAYSYTAPDAAAVQLAAIMERALGSQVTVNVLPGVPYGEEDAVTPTLAGTTAALRVALFNAVATPEQAAHGRFLQHLAAAPGTAIALIDESVFDARRFDEAQRQTRRGLWRELADAARIPAVFINLAQPDLARAEADLEAALAAH
jgi:hypothetical protein